MGSDFDTGSSGGTITAGPVTDQVIIAMVRGGDTDAFDSLYRRHLAAAQYVARANTDNPSDADDIVAEAFASVFQALSSGKGPREFFRAYLLTVVQRTAHARNRKARLTQSAPDDAMLDTAVVDADPILKEFESSAVAAAFKSLPERWQAVLWHVDIEGMKPAAAAPFIGISPNGVSSLLIRAREGLRQAYLQNHVVVAPDDECSEYSGQLGKYARNALKRTSHEKVTAHLETCSKCTALLFELNHIQGAMRAALFPLVTGIVLTPGAVAGLLSASNSSALTGEGPATVRSLGHVGKVAAAAAVAAGVAIFGLVAWFGQSGAQVNNAGDAPSTSAASPSASSPSASSPTASSPTRDAPIMPSPAQPAAQLPQPFISEEVRPHPVSEEIAKQRAAVVTNSGTVSSTTEATPSTAAPSQSVDAVFGMEAGGGVLERDISVGFSLLGGPASGSGETTFSLPENATFIPGKFSAPTGWSCSDPAADNRLIRCTTASIEPASLAFKMGVSLGNPEVGSTLSYQFGGQHVLTKSFANGFH
ncbi:sigma-70 family RNA polymerase sigma factor [Paenarthrobacter sp. RAF54_2]|uniref:sigma-70 family RNA polymerase sigma factor n=1 Tax=Paenarthrobacter sp. RAF54_2 TaxID=3233061 RepID=UPI003F9774FB